ncbi:MAG: hypothetical protein FWG63_05075 [Defluviitaleaceae bacterium]|nr:hypothetical protein [Defluviitaleaceae bacterium]
MTEQTKRHHQWHIWEPPKDASVFEPEDLKLALAAELHKLTDGEISILREFRTDAPLPYFFVHMIDSSLTPAELNVNRFKATFTVLYRIAENREQAISATDGRLQETLDKMGYKLIKHMESVDLFDMPVSLLNRRFDKVNDELHVFFEVDIRLRDFPPEVIWQWRLSIQQELKG